MRQPLRNEPASILHNPVAIGGLAAVAVVFVVTVVIVLLGGGNSSGDSDSSARIAPAAKTPTEQQSNGLDGLTGKATRTVNVRSGPGNNYSALGMLPRGSEIRITGQDDEGEWLQIEYPIHSDLHGWVILSSLEVQGDLADAPIATPEALPLADVPTSEAAETTPELTPAVTPTETSTPAPALPDLAVSGSLVSGGILVVTITNQGTGALPTTPLDLSIFDVSGSPALNSITSSVSGLAPGASIDIRTGYVPFGGPPQVLVIVDPNGKIAETDDTNNRLTVTLSPGVTPTATKTPHP